MTFTLISLKVSLSLWLSIASTFGVGKSTVYKSEDKLKTFQKEVEDGDCIKKEENCQKSRFCRVR